jgi:hypothetical protein
MANCHMKGFALMPASVLALFAAAPAIAQGIGPNDAFIDQLSGNAAEVTHAGKGKLNKSTSRATDGAYVKQFGPDDLGRNDASAADVGVGRGHTATQGRSRRSNAADLNSNIAPASPHEHAVHHAVHNVRKSPKRSQASPTAPPSRAHAGGGLVGAKPSPR